MTKTTNIPAWERVGTQPPVIPTQIQALLPGIARLPKSTLAADTLRVPDLFLLPPTRRLVVLVPAGEFNENALARRIWQLASCSELDVLYLTLSPDAEQVFYQRRRLISLAAQSAYPHLRTDISVSAEKNWYRALRQTIKAGDLLICMGGENTPSLLQRKTVSERLTANLGVPVYELGDLQVTPAPPIRYWVRKALSWGVSIALLAAFFWMQLGIDRLSARPQSILLASLSVVAEVYILWKINEWIG